MSATTHTAVALFAEYRKDHQAALEPCMMCMFEKCPEAEREKLDALVESFYEDVSRPHPPYSPVQMRRIHEKMAPIFDRAMQDPAVIAAEDQRKALWRDTAWWRKRWLRVRFMVRWTLYLRVRNLWCKKPWE